MEKKKWKSKVKIEKTEKGFKYWRKNEESRKQNNKFLLYPGGVYSGFGKTVEGQSECERPRYDQEKLKKGEKEERMFQAVKEASEF